MEHIQKSTTWEGYQNWLDTCINVKEQSHYDTTIPYDERVRRAIKEFDHIDLSRLVKLYNSGIRYCEFAEILYYLTEDCTLEEAVKKTAERWIGNNSVEIMEHFSTEYLVFMSRCYGSYQTTIQDKLAV